MAEPPHEGLRGLRRFGALLVGQLGVVTALAFYFGWARTSAWLGHFGLDSSVVDFGTTDYVLRSVGAAYWPLMGGGVLVVLALAAHPRLRTWVRGLPRRRRREVLAGAAATAAVLLAVALAGLAQVWVFPPSVPVIPLLITGGTALATYVTVLAGDRGPQAPGLLTTAQFVAMCVVIAGGVFWAWGSYAAALGSSAARDTAAHLAHRTDVAVFSTQRLGLNGPGVVVDAIGDDDSRYRFRYTGLRLLLRAEERWYLLPRDWQRGQDAVFVLRESDGLRLQFVAPP